jgi:hypothetical protein
VGIGPPPSANTGAAQVTNNRTAETTSLTVIFMLLSFLATALGVNSLVQMTTETCGEAYSVAMAFDGQLVILSD